MTKNSLATTFILIAACGSAPVRTDAQGTRTQTQAAGETTDLCSQDGTGDFAVWGCGLSAYEGARVTAVAVQPEDPREPIRVVRISTVIRDGGFSLACPEALSPNLEYPSFGVFIDVNGDGGCSEGDLGFENLLYGWAGDVEQQIPPEDSPEWSWSPVEQMPTCDAPFCEYYDF